MNKGKFYKAVAKGFNGEIFLAWDKCKKCGGIGTLGKNLTTGGAVECKCLKFTKLPIMWVVL
jgi:hypothetical protein